MILEMRAMDLKLLKCLGKRILPLGMAASIFEALLHGRWSPGTAVSAAHHLSVPSLPGTPSDPLALLTRFRFSSLTTAYFVIAICSSLLLRMIRITSLRSVLNSYCSKPWKNAFNSYTCDHIFWFRGSLLLIIPHTIS